MENSQPEPSQFYTGLVAQLYAHLRSKVFDPQPYRRFVTLAGEPALELGDGSRATPDDAGFTFWLRHDEAGQPGTS